MRAKTVALANYCPVFSFFYENDMIPETRFLTRGKIIHKKLGYDNEEMYTIKLCGVEIKGVPDRIGDKYVLELKTGSDWNKSLMYSYLYQLAIYMLMTRKDGLLLYYNNNRFIKAYRLRYHSDFIREFKKHVCRLVKEAQKIKSIEDVKKWRRMKKCRICPIRNFCWKIRYNNQLDAYL